MLKKIYKFIPFVLIFVFLFSFEVMGASSGSPSLANTFPVMVDEKLYSDFLGSDIISFSDLKDSALEYAKDFYSNYDLNYEYDVYAVISGHSYIYFCFYDSSCTTASLSIGVDIARVNLNFSKWSVGTNNGKNTISNFWVCARYFSDDTSRIDFSCGRNNTSSSAYFELSAFQSATYQYVTNEGGLYSSYYPVHLEGNSPQIDINGSMVDMFIFDSENSGDDNPDNDDTIAGDIDENDPNAPLFSALKKFFQDFLRRIQGYFEDLKSYIGSLFSELRDVLSSIYSYLQSIASYLLSLLYEFQEFVAYLFDFSFDFERLKLTSLYQLYLRVLDFLQFFQEIRFIVPAERVAFPLDFTKTDVFSSVGIIYINFDWYPPFRDTFSFFFLAFFVVAFIWHIVKEIPSIIAGFSGRGSGGN